MTKFLAIPNNMIQLKGLLKTTIGGVILGVQGFSVFNQLALAKASLKDVVLQLKTNNKVVFVLLNKVIYNQDIPLLKEYLLFLEELNLNGILYEDVAILNLSQKLGLKTPLGWMSEHLATTKDTCNYWGQQGVKYIGLANELTLDEVLKIRKGTTMPLMLRAFGYLPMAQSSRNLVTNYFEAIKSKGNDSFYYLYEGNSKKNYPIYEGETGTCLFSANLLNSILVLPTLVSANIDYLILDGWGIKDDVFERVCTIYEEALNNLVNSESLQALAATVHSLCKNKTDQGFLFKETVYRVKGDE